MRLIIYLIFRIVFVGIPILVYIESGKIAEIIANKKGLSTEKEVFLPFGKKLV